MSKAKQGKNGVPPATDAQLQKAAEDQQARLKQVNERVTGLLQGKVQAPSELATYFIQKARQTGAEFEAATATMRQLSVQLEQIKEKRLVLKGQQQAALDDLVHWLEKDDVKKDKTPPVVPEAMQDPPPPEEVKPLAPVERSSEERDTSPDEGSEQEEESEEDGEKLTTAA